MLRGGDRLNAILRKISQVSRHLNGRIQIAQAIDQPIGQCLLTCPNTSLPDRINRLYAHTSPFRTTSQEGAVISFNSSLHQHFLVRRHRSSDIAQIGKGMGFHHVGGDIQLLEQSSHVGEHTKDTDRAGQGVRLSYDLIGCARDVITTRSRHVTHRNHHRLLLLQSLHLFPDLIGDIGTTTR